jgi:hypothetical protein
MDGENIFLILTFDSTHHAMRAESILKDEKISIKTIPTPRDITLSCGLAIKASVLDKERIIKMNEDKTLDFKNLYEVSTMDNKRELKKII